VQEENQEEFVIRNEREQKVRRLVEELPPEQREVLVLRHYAELSFKEIADLTNVSINTALGRMRYALNNLRKLIEEHNIAF
jgi:RNA polymerase sigma-70 factor (ECF subfamily)